MNLRDLKQFIDSISESDLDKPFLYNSEEYSVSGEIASIEVVKENLYWSGEDSPTPLYTKKQFKYEGYELDEMELEIPKGSIVAKF